MATLTLSRDYGYVLLAASSTFVLGAWHGLRIGSFRKAAKITYPDAYADSAQLNAAESPQHKKAMYLFNCAQRSHTNFLENQPSVIAALLIAGINYPLSSAALGLGWVVSRVLYAVGYTSPSHERGKGRAKGLAFFIFQYLLFGLAGWTSVQMIL